MPGPGSEKPHSSPARPRSVARPAGREVEVAGKHDDVLRLRLGHREPRGAQQLGLGEALVGGVARAVQVRDDECAPGPVGDAHRLHDPPLLRPREAGARTEAEHAGLRVAKAPRVQRQCRARAGSRSVGPTRIAFPWPENADRRSPWFGRVSAARAPALIGIGPTRGRAATSACA